MTSHRAVLWLSLVLAGCRGGDKPSPVDSSATSTPPPPGVSPVALNLGWNDSAAGPVLLLPVSESPSRASAVLPYLTDSALVSGVMSGLDSLSGLSVDLFGPAGSIGSSTLATAPVKRGIDGCVLWPEASLSTVPNRVWRIGLRKGVATGLPLDSVESMAVADSSRMTAELARLASALVEGVDPAFRGLPFSVRKAYRFSFDGTSVIVSDVVRKIAEEANPREEHILLVAERLRTGGGSYTAAFHSRVSGAEDIVRTHDILGVVRFVRNAQPAIVVAFGYENGGRLVLLERAAEKSWKLNWRSAYSGC